MESSVFTFKGGQASSPIKKSPHIEQWLMAVEADFSKFLQDHASCERKAMATALSLISRYPHHRALVEPMICIAKEELHHFHEVYRLIKARGISLASQDHDPYVKGLLKNLRHAEQEYFLDKLLCCGLIEARSAERFEILATRLKDDSLREFYGKLAQSEKGHWKVFMNIAATYYDGAILQERMEELIEAEYEHLKRCPIRSAVH